MDITGLPPDVATLVLEFYTRYAAEGDAARVAVALGERACEAIEAAVGGDHPLLGDIAEILWSIHLHLGDPEAAAAWNARIITALDRPTARPSRKLGMAYKRLAVPALQEKRTAEALDALRRGIAAFVRAGAGDDVEAGKLHYMEGLALFQVGDKEASRAALLESLPILRKYDEGRRQRYQALRMLATIAMDDEDPGDALSHLNEAAGALGDKVDPKSDEFLELGLEIGRCLIDLKHHQEAEEHMRQLLEVMEKLRPAGHPLVGKALRLLGDAQLECSEGLKARKTFDRAIRGAARAHGAQSAEVAALLGRQVWAHALLGHHAAAATAAKRAVDIYERIGAHSPTDASLVDATWLLAERLAAARRWDEAEAAAKRVYDLLVPIVGEDHPRAGQVLGLRGTIRFERGDRIGALPLLDAALRLLDLPDAPSYIVLPLARMAAEARLDALKDGAPEGQEGDDKELERSLQRVIEELQRATREAEDEAARLQHGVGLTPRRERS